MCVVSAVHDHFEPIIPWIQPVDQPYIPPQVTVVTNTGIKPFITFSLDDLRAELAKLVSDFTKAIAAAKVVDELTNQPDCVDPEKAKLLDKVKELINLLNKAPEFVVVKKGGLKLEPGKYRVVAGELWKIEEKKIE